MKRENVGRREGVRRAKSRMCPLAAGANGRRKANLPLVNYRQKGYYNGTENKVPNLSLRAFREIGKVLVNFGNLTFTSLILGTIIKGDFDPLTMIFVGAGVVLSLITVGIIALTLTGGEKWN